MKPKKLEKDIAANAHLIAQVRKTPSWPRS
jgi:hypothetical protein